MKYFGFLMLLYSSFAFATDYSASTTIKGVSIGDGYVRVKLMEMKAVENCPDQAWYVLDTTTESSKLSFSGILSANAAKTKLSLQLVGCHPAGSKTYPKINHVYLCDTQYCN